MSDSASADLRTVRLRTAALHLLTLSSFAIAQPLLSVLGRNPEFMVSYHLGLAGVLWLTLGVAVAPPLLLFAFVCLAGVAGAKVRRAVLCLCVGLLSATVAQELFNAVHPPWHVSLVVSGGTGLAAALAYRDYPRFREFLTFLTPSVVVFAAAFLLTEPVRKLARAHEPPVADVASANVASKTPIVFMVFDQLPLDSLLGPDQRIDRERYPAFAGLADEAHWFRNATAVGNLTGWALPPILTGRYPRPGQLPSARDYPRNLFTLLGKTYRFESVEPITALCPESLCPRDSETILQQVTPLAADLTVVYLHALLPHDSTGWLPPVTQNWKAFAAAAGWQRRWIASRDQDRRYQPGLFVRGISRDDPQPTLYFLHALLPHEPYIYLPTGQRFNMSSVLPGLGAGGTGIWGNDEWSVAQNYRDHLLQLGYVDALLGRALARLKEQGLYDRSLIVVTSDHGVSFRPRHSFKGLDETNRADIMSVPLLIKTPLQQKGMLTDRNVEAIDVLPTIADILQVPLPWGVDGVSAIDEQAPERSRKIIYWNVAYARQSIEPDRFLDKSGAAARRWRLLPDGNPMRLLTISPEPELIGRPVDPPTFDAAAAWVTLESPGWLANVDPTGDVFPVLLNGNAVRERGGRPEVIRLAIAVNGTIRATTQTPPFTVQGRRGFWRAFVPPDAFRRGANQVAIFTIEQKDGKPVLRLGYQYPTRR